MPEARRAATLSPVIGDSEERRGQVVDRRMRNLGMKAKDLAAVAGASRSLLYRVLRDDDGVREESYRLFERTLDRIEHEHGHGGPDVVASTEQGLIEFEVSGDFGVRVVVKGPIENAAQLEEQVARLIRDIRDTPQ